MAVLSIVQVALLIVTLTGKTGQEGDCPPWFEMVNTTWTSTNVTYCACSSTFSEYIECDQKQQQSSLTLGSCVFYDSGADDVMAARCNFVFPKLMIKNNVIPLPHEVGELNTTICGNLSRAVEGPFCGKCVNGTGPSLYSIGNECVPCRPVNVLYYLLLQYLPTTVIVLMVVIFRLNVTSAPMAHYVLFCNMVVLYLKSDIAYVMCFTARSTFNVLSKILLTLSAVWSFDVLFFVSPPLCISPHMEDIYKPFIDFLASLYPFMLLLLMYVGTELHARDFKPIVILWRPLHLISVHLYRTWEPNASIIQAFSSLFFLSYAKLLFVIAAPFFISAAVNAEGKRVDRLLYLFSTVSYLSKGHIYLIIFSIFITIFLFLPPLILLIIYPTSFFEKISRHFKPRWRIAIKAYVETFQSCFKDGTNGTRDYRAVSGYVLAIGLPFLTLQGIVTSVLLYESKTTSIWNTNLYISIFFLISMTIVCVTTQPYKHKIANISAVILLLLFTALTGMSASILGGNVLTQALFLFLLSFPHCALGGYVLRKIIKRCQNNQDEGAHLVEHAN